MRPRRALSALGAAAFLLLAASCTRVGVRPGPRPVLSLKVVPAPPARLEPGGFVRVTARCVPPVALGWVSGTVGILGAPVVAFRRGPAGAWSFRTMVPPFLNVPPGTYRVKAWGRTLDGRAVRGEMDYEVE